LSNQQSQGCPLAAELIIRVTQDQFVAGKTLQRVRPLAVSKSDVYSSESSVGVAVNWLQIQFDR
jgi:hypothetical protein